MLHYSVLTKKGQVTLPLIIRKKLKLKPGDRIYFVIKNHVATIYKDNYLGNQIEHLNNLNEWDSSEDNEAYRDL